MKEGIPVLSTVNCKGFLEFIPSGSIYFLKINSKNLWQIEKF
jgi:hypothetical protein